VFEVRAKDDVGNITPVVKRTFTVDRTAPVISASLAEGARTGTSLTVAMAANEAVGWQCSLDGAPLADCGNPVTYNGLTPGEHVFQAVAIDTAGNRGEMLTRRFTVEAGFVPAPPATQPVEPTVTVVDEVTKLPLTIRTVDIDRRVDLQRIQQAGIRVTVRPATGAKLIRFRIFKVRTDGDAAAAATRPVVTIYRTARKGTNTIRLTRKELRGVRVGSYRMEISAGHDRKRLGKSVVRAFRVTR
jgi:hypothetical protein